MTEPMARPTRGLRNRNPLNIRISNENQWVGEDPNNPDKAFERFVDDIWGLRAGARLMRNHQRRRGANTIARLISIWAPPNENDTADYIAHVAERTGFGADESLDLRRREHLTPVLKAMIMHENAGHQPYSDELIDSAIDMADQEFPPLPRERPVSLRTPLGLTDVKSNPFRPVPPRGL